MDAVETIVGTILDGGSLEGEVLCDSTIADQNEASAAKGIAPSASSDYVPIVTKSVTFVVLGVLVNSKNEVLMIQEAKESCAGQWYLPAGRMEEGETIEDAVKREVLEETGLEMKPTTILMMESANGSWFRFVLTGEVVGGTLKTTAQSDADSLQAKWVSDVNELTLRSTDIVDIIERARIFHGRRPGDFWHEYLLPLPKPHKKLLLRLVVCIKQKSSNRLHVLMSEKTGLHLPTCEIYPARSLHSTLKRFMIEIFGADLSLDSHKPHGLLTLEHYGKPAGKHDGFVMTVIISFRVPLEEVYPIDKYSWVMVSKELEDRLTIRIRRNLTVPVRVVR